MVFFLTSDPAALENVHFSKMARTLRRIKHNIFPKSPTTIEQLMNEFNKEHIKDNFGQTRDNREFFRGTVSGVGYSCAIFASGGITDLIERHIPLSERVYLADATFKIVPVGLFTQLLVLYVAYKDDIFPFAYVLMTKKTEQAYKDVFEYIKTNIFDLSPARMLMDFEVAMRKAFLAIYPGVKLIGCWFHHNQAVRRRASKISGFFQALSLDSELEQGYRKFMKLPLLPANVILQAYDTIKSELQAKTNVFDVFLAYYQRQWIIKASVFSIQNI